jgi:deoxyribodipyrimidine photo-lyase
MKTALWWIRRDVRLEHNVALARARTSAERVVPVFVLDPALLSSPYFSEKRFAFLVGGLRELDASLRERGSRLIVRRGTPARVLPRLVRETKAEAIYCEQDVSPYARARDQGLARSLPLQGVWGVSYLSPKQALKSDGAPYTQFTAFRRTWRREAAEESFSILRAPRNLPGVGDLGSEPLPEPKSSLGFPPGEKAAGRALSRFLKRIDSYRDDRNRLDREGTSKLSPYLRFGMISPHRVVRAALEAIDHAPSNSAKKSAETWLSELVWREFYISILYHFPQARRESFRPEGRFMAWRDDEEGFAAWCAGETGYPVVDAGMRELASTGFLHNRARMIAASFLTKHLLIDWRRGERWFMQRLVDGDPAANNGGWQWTAGTGTDAAPYFRIFNPVLQGKRFDPEGRYLKTFLPGLEERPGAEIHEPLRPIVSHTKARVRALSAFREAKERARGAK